MTRRETAATNRGGHDVGSAGRVGLVAAAALAIVAMVLGIRVLTDARRSEPGAGGPAASSGPQAPGSAAPTTGSAPRLDLFPPGESETDTQRQVSMDLDADWPLMACDPVGGPEVGRIEFLRGYESGPEFERTLAVGWYADAAAAQTAYDALLVRLAACAPAGSGVTTTAASLGRSGTVVAVSVPAEPGWVELTTNAVALVEGVVVLATDRAQFTTDAAADPSSADTTRQQAERLLAEICLAEASRC